MLIPFLRKIKAIQAFVPSGLAMGIAFIIPAFYSLVMFYGMCACWIWKMLTPQSVERFNFAVASGFIAGEGLMGIVNAALTLLGIE
ncbi:MAG: OPT/YSL family transporter [Pirellulales bacterium]|nr:OPT/YSL family transporter [Pirellulales bacterium]